MGRNISIITSIKYILNFDKKEKIFLINSQVFKIFYYFSFPTLLLLFLTFSSASSIYAQTTYFTPGSNQTSNYIKSSVFRQEIARFQINVVRAGKSLLPITQVPRVEKGDILKVKLLDEAVGGIKLDQSRWDWTFLVAYINPLYRMQDGNSGQTLSDAAATTTAPISEEINFRKRGWYKEYSFLVPYDSQPVFFLYPRPKYRKQLMKVVNSKYEEIRKLGEKTIEIAGAYAQISSFLNEMQIVLNRNASLYGYTFNGNNPTPVTNPYNSYNPYSYPYNTNPNNQLQPNTPLFGLNSIPALNQVVESLAKSFNIQLPSCWGNTSNFNNYGNYTGGYSSGSGYNSGYSSNNSGNTTADFVNRAQCVAKNVSLEDFDISVTKLWQQGGVFLAAELQKKFPQLAYYINIAAAAIDFIVKAFQKSPLRIVPSIIQSSDNQGGIGGGGSYGGTGAGAYGNSFSTSSPNPNAPNPVKISLFADSQPSEGQFVTAYPIVVHKWQANPDPEVISLYPPVLVEPCLHSGQNILKNTDLSEQWTDDTYSRDFKLVMTSSNGFRKEFPLRKNIGLGGWELNITPEDMNQFPKVNMLLESELTGTRGFNEIKSQKFELPISIGGAWEIKPESLKAFTVGGKRTITLRNTLGSCRCLQRVIYKPSFGGQFVFEANSNSNPNAQNNPNSLQFSSDGREVSFEIDATTFQPGNGTLEVKSFGGDNQPQPQIQSNQPGANNLPLKLYPAPPSISEIKARRGDREVLITGERLEQILFININGRRAIVKGNNGTNGSTNPPAGSSSYSNQNQPNTYLGQYPGQSSSPVQNQVAAPSTGSPQTSSSTQLPSQYQNINQNQRIAVFEDQSTKIVADSIALELTLEDNRQFQYPNRFPVGASRPSIRANEMNEIEGTFLNNSTIIVKNDQVQVNGSLPKNKDPRALIPNQPQIDLSSFPVVSVDKTGMTVAVQNVLTDYNFRLENLSMETRVENATTNPNELPTIKFDVLDSNNLRLNFTFNQATNKTLSGRRLQFRIRDRERGDSDWYTIKQTFVRIPQIESIKCTNEMNNQCQLTGDGLDYIIQVSTDGGRSWFPQAPNTLQVQPTSDGKMMMLIPQLVNKTLLQIKLRDFPKTDGLAVSNFVFSNMVKIKAPLKSPNNPNQPPPNQSPNGAPNQPVSNPLSPKKLPVKSKSAKKQN